MAYDLELIGVRKIYDNGTVAVQNFDLRVDKGEFISFVGPSGCGKTTTLRMIAGFEAISGGDVFVRGKRINDLPPERRPTSTIFQNFALFPHMTVRQNIEYGLAVKGMHRADRRRKVDEIMEKFDLGPVADRKDSGLSGGQRQRVALARGLVVEPDILLLDEPLGALDANLRKSIQNELKLLQRNLGITFIFVTHAQSEALVLSDRMIVMNSGVVEQISEPHEVYRRPRTPFVARFIGRNTILPGRLAALDGREAAVETAYGGLRGFLNDPALNRGDAVGLVIPSEAIDVHPHDETERAALAERYQGNLLSARLERSWTVGHHVKLTLVLEGGIEMHLESHVEKYAGRLGEPGSAILVGWNPNEASVIRQD